MQGDLPQILEASLTPDGKIDVTSLNNILRQMQEKFFALEGRTQPSQVRNDLDVLGSVAVAGDLAAAGGGLSLDGTSLRAEDPSLSPLTDPDLAGEALVWTSSLGAVSDTLSASNPLTWVVKDEFLGGASALGRFGELDWSTVGVTAVSVSESGHPGVLGLTAGSADALFTNDLLGSDARYFYAVVQPVNGDAWIGLMQSPTLANEVSQGWYFSLRGVSSGNWRTVTRSAAGVTANTTSIPATLGSWFLLEMVVDVEAATGTGTVDFYINRQRAFRHSGSTVGDGTLFPTIGLDAELKVDRVAMGGFPRIRIWT